MIAKQILSTLVYTVAVEQQFGTDGNILDSIHSLLSLKSIQIQACVDDWMKVQNRQQEIDQEDPYDFLKNDQPTLEVKRMIITTFSPLLHIITKPVIKGVLR
ncbi:hypothetical protein Ddye_005097 [Dipteronia dyeriana]|uniref:HAT C-terminal dimerisation domain-containing protein n=1 Tax=Dipteronia dyeriana TaxID=168575 RepID=A0AAD9XFM1_9ROSI|nr:hypothetical protein Ddye_005097 [Dipteronia dyeriana]